MVYSLLDENKKVCTLGPIIHNKEMVEELERRGVRTVDEPGDVEEGRTVVIRSHGVPQSIYGQIAELGLDCADATCPFVAKIHRTVARESRAGKTIFIIGDKNHPEVQGVEGHCEGGYFTLDSPSMIEELAVKFPYLKNKDICVVAQTTFDVSQWKKCLETVKRYIQIPLF